MLFRCLGGCGSQSKASSRVSKLNSSHREKFFKSSTNEIGTSSSPIKADFLTSRVRDRLRGYSPLGRGFLTGRFLKFDDLPADDYRREQPHFQNENFQKNLDLVREVEAIARQKGATPSQLALAWVLAQGDDVVAITGTKHVKYLEENVRASRVKLSDDELRRFGEIRRSPMARAFIIAITDGLGRAAALTLIDEGHDVVLHARSREEPPRSTILRHDPLG